MINGIGKHRARGSHTPIPCTLGKVPVSDSGTVWYILEYSSTGLGVPLLEFVSANIHTVSPPDMMRYNYTRISVGAAASAGLVPAGGCCLLPCAVIFAAEGSRAPTRA